MSPTEAWNQTGLITFQWWFMIAPTLVASDWILNSRDPNDGALLITPGAHPFRILRTGLAQLGSGSTTTQMPVQSCRIRADLKFRGLGIHLPHFHNVYFGIKPIIENDAAGAFSAQEVAITWNVALLARPPLDIA